MGIFHSIHCPVCPPTSTRVEKQIHKFIVTKWLNPETNGIICRHGLHLICPPLSSRALSSLIALSSLLCLTLFRNSVMFNNELMADVHFVVGQTGRTQRLPGHRVRIWSPGEIRVAGRKWTNKQSAWPAQCCSYHISIEIIFVNASNNGTEILCARLSLLHHVSFRDSPQLFM